MLRGTVKAFNINEYCIAAAVSIDTDSFQ